MFFIQPLLHLLYAEKDVVCLNKRVLTVLIEIYRIAEPLQNKIQCQAFVRCAAAQSMKTGPACMQAGKLHTGIMQ